MFVEEGTAEGWSLPFVQREKENEGLENDIKKETLEELKKMGTIQNLMMN